MYELFTSNKFPYWLGEVCKWIITMILLNHLFSAIKLEIESKWADKVHILMMSIFVTTLISLIWITFSVLQDISLS